MFKIIICSSLILALVYSYIISKKLFSLKLSITTSILTSSISILYIGLIFYFNYISDYLIYMLLFIIIIFLVLLELLKIDKNDFFYSKFVIIQINNLLLLLVYNILWICIIREFSFYHYSIQLLILFLGITIYILIQLIYHKLKLTKVHEAQLYIACVIVTIIIGGFFISSTDSFDSNLYDYFDSENRIVDQKLEISKLTPITIDYNDQAIIFGNYIYYVLTDDTSELHVYNTLTETDKILIHGSLLADLEDGYIDIIGYSGSEIIYVHTPLGLYYLDRDEILALYERDIDNNQVQYLDFYSVFYSSFYNGDRCYIYETESNKYVVGYEEITLFEYSEPYDLNEIILSEYNDVSYNNMFKFSIDYDIYQVLLNDSEIIYNFNDSSLESIDTNDLFEIRSKVSSNYKHYSDTVYCDFVSYTHLDYDLFNTFYLNDDYLIFFNDTEYCLSENNSCTLMLVNSSINCMKDDYDERYVAYEYNGYLYIPYETNFNTYENNQTYTNITINTLKISPGINSFANMITYNIRNAYYFGFIWILFPMQLVEKKKNKSHVD